MRKSSPAAAERRRYPRYPIQWPVSFTGDLIDGRGQVVNISQLGCAIECTPTLEAGTYVSLLINVRDEATPLKVELAVVRWAKDDRMGLEFIRLQPEQKHRLDGIIRFLELLPKPSG